MARVRVKECAICQQPAPVLFRVKSRAEGEWVFVCDRCLPAVKDRNPEYSYGGTWKATKKD